MSHSNKALAWCAGATALAVIACQRPAPRAEEAAPSSGSRSELQVSIRVEIPAGRNFCPGDRMKLSVEATRDAYLQVFDLYAPNRALMLFPDGDRPEGFSRARERFYVGPEEGFQAAMVEGTEAERFLVLGAETKEALGSLRSLIGHCRLDAAQLALVRDARMLPSITRAEDTVRFSPQEKCLGALSVPVHAIDAAFNLCSQAP